MKLVCSLLLLCGMATVATAQPDVVTPDAQPILGDFDGDGRLDHGVRLPHDNKAQWYVRCSGGGLINIVTSNGPAPSMPAVEDYDGDGKADVGEFYPNGRSYYYWSSRWPGWFGSCQRLQPCVYVDLTHVLARGGAPTCAWRP